MGVPVEPINKIGEGSPHVVDGIERGEVDLVINTPTGTGARADGYEIRSAAVARGIPCITTMAGGIAAARAIGAARRGEPRRPLAPGAPRRGCGRARVMPSARARSREPAHARRPSAGASVPIAAARAPRRLRGALRCDDRDGPAPRPGQFYMLAAAAPVGRRRGRAAVPAARVLRASRRPLAARRRVPPPGGPELEFLLEDVGPGDRAALRARRRATSCGSSGRSGSASSAPADGRRALLVGGGVGIAPLAIWQDELGPATTTVLLGFRDAGTRTRRGAASPARGWPPTTAASGTTGCVTELLERRARRPIRTPTVYACGPPAMLEAVRALCAARDVPAQLALESGMACGFGACFGCVVPTRGGYVRLCVDGPVLDAASSTPRSCRGRAH